VASPEGTEPPWLTVVGVAPNVRQNADTEREPDPIVYSPVRANPARSMAVLVRPRTDAASALVGVREAMRMVDPDLPVFSVMSLDEQLAMQRWPYRSSVCSFPSSR